ncbi:hypothetical protein GCM10022383_13370 [Microbacterium soli]|uniref:NAD(P)-dependent oxidoreductase n=1 Tax=Microbacterium soli TaxID=446075 RepID=A0ABP7N3T2_9MICO
MGFIGLGAMGAPMAERLLDRGRSLIVHNRTRTRAAGFDGAGVVVADSPAEVASSGATVLSCLRDTGAVEAVYLGDRGVLRAVSAGQVLVELGTFSPDLARRIAQDAADAGAAFLAAPVSGGPPRARAGTLVMMAGGDAGAFQRVRQVLEDLGQTVEHVGDAGAGLELKLVNQLLTGTHMAVAAEAVAALNALDIDLGLAERLLDQGWGQSAMLARALAVARQEAPEARGTGVTVVGMSEVLELVARLLRACGVSAEVFDAGRRALLDAGRLGYGDHDPAGLFHVKEVHR